MPKTTLFETDLVIVKEYANVNFDETNNSEDDDSDYYDKDEFIKPGMVFIMNYTQTRNYKSENASIKVEVVAVRTTIDDEYSGIHILGCVLKTDVPIYVCEYGAYLARGITLHIDTRTIASGYVKKIIE